MEIKLTLTTQETFDEDVLNSQTSDKMSKFREFIHNNNFYPKRFDKYNDRVEYTYTYANKNEHGCTCSDGDGMWIDGDCWSCNNQLTSEQIDEWCSCSCIGNDACEWCTSSNHIQSLKN